MAEKTLALLMVKWGKEGSVLHCLKCGSKSFARDAQGRMWCTQCGREKK